MQNSLYKSTAYGLSSRQIREFVCVRRGSSYAWITPAFRGNSLIYMEKLRGSSYAWTTLVAHRAVHRSRGSSYASGRSRKRGRRDSPNLLVFVGTTLDHLDLDPPKRLAPGLP